jgi:hypothetical protein
VATSLPSWPARRVTWRPTRHADPGGGEAGQFVVGLWNSPHPLFSWLRLHSLDSVVTTHGGRILTAIHTMRYNGLCNGERWIAFPLCGFNVTTT